jgi:hypothetical protein
MDPQASSTRDQPASGMSRGAERRFAGGGSLREAGAGWNVTKIGIEIQGLSQCISYLNQILIGGMS